MGRRYHRLATGGFILGSGLLVATGPVASPEPSVPTLAVKPALVIASRSETIRAPSAPVPARFVPQVRIALPEPVSEEVPPAEPPLAVAEPEEAQPPTVVPEAQPPTVVTEEQPPTAVAEEQSSAWKTDIAQITEGLAETVFVPQLHEPGLVAGAGNTLVAKVDAMQVYLPPARVTEETRQALLAEAPTEMTVRIGDEAIGKVAFRTSESGSIDVQLSGLLDLVADRLPADEFTRLRNSQAADSFVGAEQLQAVGLTLRYDPVYDELRLSA